MHVVPNHKFISFQGGPGLAFLAYPEVVSKLPSASIWAVLFFVMLISLALGSIFGAFETVITACEDQWPILRGYNKYSKYRPRFFD